MEVSYYRLIYHENICIYYILLSDTYSHHPLGLLSTEMEGHETGQQAPVTKWGYFNKHQ